MSFRIPASLATVRVRTTIAATAGLAVALVLAAAVIVQAQRSDLRDAIMDSARGRANDIAATVATNGPSAIPAQRPGDRLVIQVADDTGQIVKSSGNVNGQPLMSKFAPPVGQTVATHVEHLLDDGNDFAISAEAVQYNSHTYTILVAASLESVTDSTENLAVLFAIIVPVLIIIVGITTWITTGRALAPVDAIRNRVDSIESIGANSRVPEPSSDDEVALLARTMNRMLDRLQKANERQQEFVADASHEMRSPLTAIRTQLEVGLRYDDNIELRDATTRALDEVIGLQSLVQNLLALSRLDESKSTAYFAAVDLDDIVFEEVKRLRGESNNQFDVSGVAGGQVFGDAGQLRQAVRNVLENAERHAKSKISILLRENNKEVTLTIENDGPEIPVDQQERIFERFTRLDQARNRTSGGSGLGLSITKQVMIAHKGSVTATNSALGARFTIILPAGK